ncbi:MAG: rhodanese-like domain-containing protein [Bacteroidota bacterium]
MQHSEGFLKVSEDAKARVPQTNVQKVENWIKNGEKFHLIDVREKDEWDAGHLPQAKHLSKGIIERDIEKQIPDKDAKIVLYCGGGYRSSLAGDNLMKMGYRNVISMDGGFKGWKDAGHEVLKD